MAQQDRILSALLPLAPERYERGQEQEFRRALELALQDVLALAVAQTAAATDHGALTGLGDDDHPLYLLASDATSRVAFAANWIDLTDAGATALHKHDHGSMDGLGDDDHTIYLLAAGTRGLSASWDVGAYSITALSFITDTISEETGAAGVTIDSLLVKDGNIELAADAMIRATDAGTSQGNAVVIEADTDGAAVNSLLVRTRNHMSFIVDSNNSGSANYFHWLRDAITVAGATEAMRLVTEAPELLIGGDDSLAGMLTLYGPGAGDAEGGELRLHTGADYDASIDYFFVDAYEDDLRIGRAGSVELQYQGGADAWFFSSGVVCGAPTGGSQGDGTINVAGGYYVNGAALGAMVFVAQSSGSNLSNTATQYLGPDSGPNATEVNRSWVVPVAGTLTRMYAWCNGSPGGTADYTFSVMQNGAYASGLDVTVTHPLGYGTTSGSIAVAAGDRLSIRSVPQGTPTARLAKVSLVFVPS